MFNLNFGALLYIDYYDTVYVCAYLCIDCIIISTPVLFGRCYSLLISSTLVKSELIRRVLIGFYDYFITSAVAYLGGGGLPRHPPPLPSYACNYMHCPTNRSQACLQSDFGFTCIVPAADVLVCSLALVSSLLVGQVSYE